MNFKALCFISFLCACAGSCYFLIMFVANYIHLQQYANVTGVLRIFLTMATGMNVFGLCMALLMACVAGLFFYSYKTAKA
jgi:hypothetical protein